MAADDKLAVFNKQNRLSQIRGVCYQPTPIDSEVLPISQTANKKQVAGDLYTNEYQHLHLRDLPLIRAMGANTLHIWGWGEENDHNQFLDFAFDNGRDPLFVTIPFDPSFGSQKNEFDISDSRPQQWNKIVSRFRTVVKKYQNHPAVLMWTIVLKESDQLRHPEFFFKLVELLTHVRDEECAQDPAGDCRPSSKPKGGCSCWHPITVPLHDPKRVSGKALLSAGGKSGLIIDLETHFPKAVDIWSLQVFRGSSFGSILDDYQNFQQNAFKVSVFLVAQ
mmetsp:Transcript_18822/g.36843  ORF Transcript_18822/g.36843 Transcript_18822/m.36843 type:complete len:278 (-) Transcript_18822:4674-5507(-)